MPVIDLEAFVGPTADAVRGADGVPREDQETRARAIIGRLVLRVVDLCAKTADKERSGFAEHNQPSTALGAMCARNAIRALAPELLASLPASATPWAFHVGDRVEKFGGSYSAPGTVVGLVTTRAGLRRYVFEFDAPAGMLHIFNGDQLRPIGADHD